ncbi:MAG: NUDIX domain-containing protein [Candidatus Aenigmatarchaeota archaeon]
MPGQVVILVASAFIEKDGKYLVLQRSDKNMTNKGRWQLPEGKVRPGENLLKALRREILEETSTMLTSVKLFGIHSNIMRKGRGIFRVVRVVFKCKTIGKIKLSKDHKDYKWASLKENLEFMDGFDPKNIISVKKVKDVF